GRWWHKNEEIDLVALNEKEKKALFIEVKWKELNEGEAKRILKDLERKAEVVGLEGWNKSYGVVAKGVERKEKMREKGWPVWDLQNFKNIQR
ncbi:ATP-binding protein, partial [Thermococci archaeon]